MIIKGVILSGMVYQKLEPKPYTIYENGRKNEGYSYSLLVDLVQNDSACPTIKCSEKVYHSVNEFQRYAFLCTVDTDASNSSNRFKITGFASAEILRRDDWFTVAYLPDIPCIARDGMHDYNPFVETMEENMLKFQSWLKEQEKKQAAQGTAQPAPAEQGNPVPVTATGTPGGGMSFHPAPQPTDNTGFIPDELKTDIGATAEQDGNARAETDKQPTKTKK